MAVQTHGAQSWFLLGMLASPLTAAELHEQCAAASRLDPEFLAAVEALATRLARIPEGVAPPALETLGALIAGGERGVTAQLERLRAAGLVEAVALEGEAPLWRRLPLH